MLYLFCLCGSHASSRPKHEVYFSFLDVVYTTTRDLVAPHSCWLWQRLELASVHVPQREWKILAGLAANGAAGPAQVRLAHVLCRYFRAYHSKEMEFLIWGFVLKRLLSFHCIIILTFCLVLARS
jgi:hypothetical protein